MTHDVTTYRINNPSCRYCKRRNKNLPIEKVSECLALQEECWNSKKKAKKCPLYIADEYKDN